MPPVDGPSAPAVLGRSDFEQLLTAIKTAICEALGAAVPQLLTAKQAAQYLGLSKSSFHRARSAGQIPAPVHIEGAGDRFRRAELDKCIERLKPRRKRSG